MKYIVENSIILNNKEYIYVLDRKKIKNIYFRVKSDLKIHVSASKLVTVNYIEKLLKESATSIEKMYQHQKNKEDKGLSFLGENLIFEYQECKPYIENDYIYGISEEICKKYIYTLAYDVFLKRLNLIKQQFINLPEFTFKVRKMTSKWGVCNKKNMSITINTELIFKNIHLIDYVIIHELCHFKYMNHSKEYWEFVSKFYPYYKRARKELKD